MMDFKFFDEVKLIQPLSLWEFRGVSYSKDITPMVS